MAGHDKREPSQDLATRMLAKPYFAIGWVAFLVGVLMFVSWPIRNFALVCWIYGSDGYFQKGIRVVPGKPIRFSDGAAAPTLPDMVTGFGAFVVTVFGLSLLLVLGLRAYERHFGKGATDVD